MIFIDTSAFIALTFPSDSFHKKANAWWKKNEKESFVTSDLVVIETLGWIRYKGGKKIAVEAGERFYSGRGLSIVKVSPEDEENAWENFKKLDGKSVSMVDSTSFVVMERLKIKKVFTFDKDFEKAGFTLLPGSLT